MGEEEEETLRICYNHIGVHFSCYVAAHPHLNSISTHNNHNNSSNDIQANHSNKSHTSTSNHPHPHPHEVNGPLLVVSPGIWHHLVVSVDYTENSSHKTDQKQGTNDDGTTHRDTKVGDSICLWSYMINPLSYVMISYPIQSLPLSSSLSSPLFSSLLSHLHFPIYTSVLGWQQRCSDGRSSSTTRNILHSCSFKRTMVSQRLM